MIPGARGEGVVVTPDNNFIANIRAESRVEETRNFAPQDSRGRLSLRELFLRERLFVQRAAAIRWRNVGFQKIRHTLVGVNLIFYF